MDCSSSAFRVTARICCGRLLRVLSLSPQSSLLSRWTTASIRSCAREFLLPLLWWLLAFCSAIPIPWVCLRWLRTEYYISLPYPMRGQEAYRVSQANCQSQLLLSDCSRSILRDHAPGRFFCSL